MGNLEEVKPQVEETIPTPVVEEVKSTQIVETPTVRTYTQKELDEAVGKGNSSLNQQIALQRQANEATKAELEQFKSQDAVREAHIQALKKEVEEALSDDPDRQKAYTSRIVNLEREQKIAQREAAAEKKLLEAGTKEQNILLATRAREIMEETGVPLDDIKGCATEQEMRIKAYEFQLAKKNEPVEEAKPAPKFDSAISSGSQQMPSSASDKIRAGWGEIHK